MNASAAIQASILTEWLVELGRLQGTSFELDHENKCTIQVNDQQTLYLFGPPANENFHISIKLLPVSGSNPELLFRTALSLNHAIEHMKGACIALDELALELMLNYCGTYEGTTFDDFCGLLNALIEASDAVTHQLEPI